MTPKKYFFVCLHNEHYLQRVTKKQGHKLYVYIAHIRLKNDGKTQKAKAYLVMAIAIIAIITVAFSGLVTLLMSGCGCNITPMRIQR